MIDNTKNNKILFLAQFSILTAIEAIVCFTPLGSLPTIGPIVATLMMIPVIITAILLGTKAGTVMGAIAGLFSFLVWTFMTPSPLAAFVFTPFYSLGEFHGNAGSLIICFVPRILSGTVAGVLYKAIIKLKPGKNVLSMVIGSGLGSLTNTFGVMLGIWLFFGNQYSAVAGEAMLTVIGTTVLISGLPEAAVAAVICPAICRAVMEIRKKRNT